MSVKLPAVWPSDAPRNALTWQTTKCACRDLTAMRTRDDAGTPTTVSADAVVDFWEVCLVAPRDTHIALVPCGHQRFCESCANEVHNQGRTRLFFLPHAYQHVAASVLTWLTIWYSKEGTGRGCRPPTPLLAVPNVTAHPSTASVPTSYYSM